MELSNDDLKLIVLGRYHPSFQELQLLAEELLHRRDRFQITMYSSTNSEKTEEYVGQKTAQA